ncbi:MAG: SDR family oxidoreductase [Bryobacteraceae bacterium]|nr:SDR family oxidoreductase [Bryobacteraceae bacterium]
MADFSGMTALVTGASNGIGAETAVRLGAGGANVLVHYNSAAAEAEQVLDRIRAAGGCGMTVQADLTTMSGTHGLIEQVRAQPVDILVNNAGSLIRRTGTLEMTEEIWDKTMMLNLTSAFFLTQALLPGMLDRGRGFIVNVSSVAARTGGGVGAGAYAAAKAAISALTKNLTKEFAAKGIRVNCVSPGTIDTNYHRQFSNEQMLNAVRAATPLGRLGTSDEIADLIVYLCTPGASYMQGQVIEINGGFLMA